MQLSQEDSLRINVLLNQPLQAVRIDEGKMIVYGLTEKGEAKIQLNPTCKDEVYIRRVKETISTHVLGSPGGYPVFLKRWTRMGQARSDSLESLLKLGEPEAVVAVVGASGITDEIARRAWWAMPNADNARRLLQNELVIGSTIGRELAEFLVEFLPFEEEPRNMVDSVRLVLQGELISEKEKLSLWKKGQRKNAYLVGFIAALPENLPLDAKAHADYEKYNAALSTLAEQGNALAAQLLKILCETGQAYLQTIVAILKKPANQDVVVTLFEAIEVYFSPIRPHSEKRRSIEQISTEAKNFCDTPESCLYAAEVAALRALLPQALPLLESLFVMSCVGEQLVAPVFARTDAVGSVMRRKLEPVLTPLLTHIHHLLGKAA